MTEKSQKEQYQDMQVTDNKSGYRYNKNIKNEREIKEETYEKKDGKKLAALGLSVVTAGSNVIRMRFIRIGR